MAKKEEFWKDKKVLVTGATGLLGGALCKRLVKLGAQVVAIVRDWTPQSEFVMSEIFQKVSVVWGDITDEYTVRRALVEYEVEFVFHLAAQTLVPVANRAPLPTFESNIRGTWQVLDACRTVGGIRAIVLASSDKAYGEKEKLPYTEDMPLEPIYPYDVSKACAELIARSYAKTFKLPVIITRCGNFFGEGDLNFSRIVPGTIKAVLEGERPKIRSDGTPVRDWIYVEDVVDAYLLCARRIWERPSLRGEAFNFSYERPMTVLEMVKLILKLMNSNLEPIILNEAKNEIQKQYLSSRKAREVLGWKPNYTLEEGLKRTIRWYKKFFGVE